MNLYHQAPRSQRLPVFLGLVVILCGLLVAIAPSWANSASGDGFEAEISTPAVVERDTATSAQGNGGDLSCVDIVQEANGTVIYTATPCVGQS